MLIGGLTSGDHRKQYVCMALSFFSVVTAFVEAWSLARCGPTKAHEKKLQLISVIPVFPIGVNNCTAKK